MKTVLITAIMASVVCMGCLTMGGAPEALATGADPSLPIEGQAVLASTSTVHIWGVDGNETFGGISYFIVPPGRHRVSLDYRDGGEGTGVIYVYHTFEAGHYYVPDAVPNDAEKTVNIVITDRTADSAWWAENKEALYKKNAAAVRYGKGKSAVPYNPDFYENVETPFEGIWDGTWHDLNGGETPCRFIFRGNTHVWYMRDKVFTQGALAAEDKLMTLEIKDVVSTDARLPGVYGVIVYMKENNAKDMKMNVAFAFPENDTLTLTADKEYAALKKTGAINHADYPEAGPPALSETPVFLDGTWYYENGYPPFSNTVTFQNGRFSITSFNRLAKSEMVTSGAFSLAGDTLTLSFEKRQGKVFSATETMQYKLENDVLNILKAPQSKAIVTAGTLKGQYTRK